jgi:GNAT superfamily N-acetyltransferase
MTVRLATQKDEAQLMQLCHALHADNGLFGVDDEMVKAMLYRAFDRKGGLVGVIDGGNEIAAATFLLLSNFWYSKDTHLEELFSFVKPAYRKSDYARQLLEFAKKCQREIGIPLVIGIITNTRMEAKVKLYRKKLGTPAGAFFVVGGHWINETEPVEDLWVGHTHGGRRKKGNGIMDAVLPSTMTTSPLPMLPLSSGNVR